MPNKEFDNERKFKAEDWCLFLLLAAMAGELKKTETPEHAPSEAYGPDNGEYFEFGPPRYYGPDNGEYYHGGDV